jgi:glycosyltransferase involved in cell wall biosynthesis
LPDSLHIAIDASRTTVARVTGTERYALDLIRAMIQHNVQHRLTLYFRDQPSADLFPKSNLVDMRVIPFKRAWTHLRFAAELWRARPDVTFVPAHTLPIYFPGRAAVTVHDLGYKLVPQAHPARTRWYLDWTTRYSARRADVILADSQATADDLTRFYKTSPVKIHVVYPGVDAPPLRESDIHAKYNLPPRYFLFIGTLQPRKNIARIVQAYARYCTQVENPAALVLAGGKGWLYDDVWIKGVDGVHLTGYVDDADKGALYAKSVALVFPTLYEGFGFPVVESMYVGTPVIASNTSSLPELVGDAGILVDPLDINAIAVAMNKLDSDSALCDDLRARGYQQAQRFTWENAARHTLAALEQAAKG